MVEVHLHSAECSCTYGLALQQPIGGAPLVKLQTSHQTVAAAEQQMDPQRQKLKLLRSSANSKRCCWLLCCEGGRNGGMQARRMGRITRRKCTLLQSLQRGCYSTCCSIHCCSRNSKHIPTEILLLLLLVVYRVGEAPTGNFTTHHLPTYPRPATAASIRSC